MAVSCPHCQHLLEPEPAPGQEVLCPSCGSSFRLDLGSTALWPPTGAGRRLGRFELLTPVGAGAFGTVYRARDTELDRVVAVKVPRAGSLAAGEERDRFLRESRSVAQLHHPGIVPVYEVGQAGGVPFLVSEFVSGVTLADYLTGRRLTFRQAAELVAAVADTLQYAHERGVVHRDVKPANVMLDMDKGTPAADTDGAAGLVPRLMDFGLARREAGEVTMTAEGQVLGTPAYISPEQAAGEGHRVDGRADVYSLGVVLYELLTGERPFRGNQRMLLHQVLHDEPRQPRSLNDAVPRDLETVCLRAMQKEPSRRYATAGELAADLRRWLNHEPIRARPVGRLERLLRWCQRRPGVAALTAALVLVTALGFAGVSWQWGGAVKARDAAEREREAADAERARAVGLAEDLRLQRDAALRATYRANIGVASSALQLNNAGTARVALEAAPEEFRNWEWRHLASLLDGARTVLRGPGFWAVSPDGRRAASLAEDGALRIWDAATGRRAVEVRGTPSWAGPLVFTPDGRRLLANCPDGALRVWGAAGEGPTILRPGTDGATVCVCSPDGRRVAALVGLRTLREWDLASGKETAALRCDATAEGPWPLAYAPDGMHLAYAGRDHTLRVVDLAAGKEVTALAGHRSGVTALAFSPSGDRVVTGGNYPDNTVRLWDAATGKPGPVLRGHLNYITAASFSPDGTRIVSCSLDKTLRLWDAGTARCVAVLKGHTGLVNGANFNPRGTRLVSFSEDQTLRLWDAASGEPVAVLRGHEGETYFAWFTRDGRLIASRANDHTVRLWDAELVERSGVLRGHTSFVYDVAFSPDGGRVASAAWDGTARVWDATTGREVARLGHDAEILTGVAFSPDGGRLAVLERPTAKVQVWDLATRERVRALTVPGPLAYFHQGVAWGPRGDLLAAGGHDGTVRLWDARTGDPAGVLRGHDANVIPLAFRPDGRQLAAGTDDGTVRLWDTATREPAALLRVPGGGVYRLAYSADGRLLAAASGKAVHLWDVVTHQEMGVLGHGSGVYGLAFSTDGTRLVAGCADNTIRLWDVAAREEVAELRGHTDYVHAVAFSPDGTRLASASGDTTVRIWDSLPVQERAARERQQPAAGAPTAPAP
jgi:WD40 repeat protein/tRNA A-37 threonylcarbamoyl transferase component Bud32